MDFKSRLNFLFSRLGFSNITVSRYGKLDPSLISRFRTGSRLPSAGSSQMRRLCKGIVLLAEAEKKIDVLSECCCIPYVDTQQLCRELEEWLGNGGLKPRRNRRESGAAVTRRSYLNAFSEKLDALMTATDMQNIRLARALHIDASLVSRFRTGMRTPASDSWFPENFCEWITKQIMELPRNQQIQKLKPFIGAPVPDTKDDIKTRLFEWLTADPDDGESNFMDSLLDGFDSYRPLKELSSELTGAFDHIASNSEVFTGIGGLREAVIRFLSLAAIQPEPHTLYLYSDQPLAWLTDDIGFAKKWAALMAIVLQRKNRICIIHNINRSSTEMLEAIKKWIPLYMTGLIEAYYYSKPQESSFCRTMFISPGVCSIDASLVEGTEDTAKYHFNSEPDIVDYHFRQFTALLDISERLIGIISFRNPDDYRNFRRTLETASGHSKHLRDTLSVATMPEDLFGQILSRSDLDSSEREIACEYRNTCVTAFIKGLETGSITELSAFANDEKLISRRIRIDLPVGDLYYQADEFARHVRNVISLLETYSSYILCPLPESPFENVFISVWNNRTSLLIKTDEPITVFLFKNQMMGAAFSKYLDSLKQKASRGAYQKERVIKRLSEYAQ